MNLAKDWNNGEFLFKTSDLWPEEQQALFDIAIGLRKNSRIVELGCFRGGTSLLLNEASKLNGSSVYSVDISPTKIAREALSETNVSLVTSDTISAAEKWDKGDIDLLFIDAGHNLENVVTDFKCWKHHLAKDAIVIFHDYDAPHRGGVAHFGVQIAVDTIRRLELVSEDSHFCRLLIARNNSSNASSLNTEEVLNTLKEYANKAMTLREACVEDHALVCCESCKDILEAVYGKSPKIWSDVASRISTTKESVMLSANPEGRLKNLELLSSNTNGTTILTSLDLCYLLDYGLVNSYEELMNLSKDPADFVRAAHSIFLLDYACGQSIFPSIIDDLPSDIDIEELSKIIAREQLRLNLLVRTLKTIVPWTP